MRQTRRPRVTRAAVDDKDRHDNRIAAARERAGMTQAQAIQATGLSESYYKKLESGRKPLTAEAMIALSTVLQCRPVDLVPPDPDEITQEQLLLAQFRLMAADSRQLVLETARRFAEK